jgi:hypothetical protein
MNRFGRSFLVCAVACAAIPGAADARRVDRFGMPLDAAEALHSDGQAMLYSLEPFKSMAKGRIRLHGWPVLGNAQLDAKQRISAVQAFDVAIAGGEGLIGACFEPRHALRVRWHGHDYDYLLCYSCAHIEVYRDGRDAAALGAIGSAERLNGLLARLNLPLSRSGIEEQAEAKLKIERAGTPRERWFYAMPTSLIRFWGPRKELRRDELLSAPLLAQMRSALRIEYPDASERIARLLTWFGSGSGPWSGYPEYEDVAEVLLTDEDIATIADVVAGTGKENDALLEGAARYFAHLEYEHRDSSEVRRLPPATTAVLLDHVLHSGNETDKGRRERAIAVFGPSQGSK